MEQEIQGREEEVACGLTRVSALEEDVETLHRKDTEKIRRLTSMLTAAEKALRPAGRLSGPADLELELRYRWTRCIMPTHEC